MIRVLVVEPDTADASILVNRLVKLGYEVEVVESGKAAMKASATADLVLMELELPDMDGVELCRHIHSAEGTPIITLSSGATQLDAVLSLQAGADDCVVKPYEIRELLARINAVLRRAVATIPSDMADAISRGALYIDPRSRQVRLDDELVDVTRKEFDLLYLLASDPESVVSRKELMSRVWADDWATSSRTIDTHVSTLRNKLGDSDWVVTVRGVGYRLGAGGRRDGASRKPTRRGSRGSNYVPPTVIGERGDSHQRLRHRAG